MISNEVVQLTREALWIVLVLSGPPIIVASAVGLIMAIIQAVTQIQEQTLLYAVKFFAIVVTLLATASLLGGTLYQFSDRLLTDFPRMVR
ncbi:type III secretion system export apparatus subunit SctS [Chitinivorax sp. PXF-14]|uniref:type III secretion system export apparatus subunit SctS n=1 Tax=Chitinivorax sp. PXF-14 TaxID=3230488 RepID=UPI003467C40B